MKFILSLLLAVITTSSFSQEIADIFRKSDTKFTWLGIDYSHVKLIGDFSQIWGIDTQDGLSIKTEYFPAWNNFVYKEPDKYNLIATFRKEHIAINLDDIDKINRSTPLEEMEAITTPNYTQENIQQFIKDHQFTEKEGIGLLLVAESYDKTRELATYHFVAINMKNNAILLYDVFKEKAGGFGLRNYWAKTFYNTLDQIKSKKYNSWKKQFLKN